MFTSTIANEERAVLTEKLENLRGGSGFTGKAPGGPSRWSTERSGEWEPVRPELVVEVRFDQVTGMPRTVVTSKVPLRDENGMVIGIIGVGFDITERKLAEQRLAQGEHLESIGRLAAGVAHEINTPIQYLNDSVYFIREAMQDLLAHNARLTSMLPVQPEVDAGSWGFQRSWRNQVRDNCHSRIEVIRVI